MELPARRRLCRQIPTRGLIRLLKLIRDDHKLGPAGVFVAMQQVANAAHQAMRENGVRFNDFSTFTSGNAYLAAKN